MVWSLKIVIIERILSLSQTSEEISLVFNFECLILRYWHGKYFYHVFLVRFDQSFVLIFLISLCLPLWPLHNLEICRLISKYLGFSRHLSAVYFLFNFVVLRNFVCSFNSFEQQTSFLNLNSHMYPLSTCIWFPLLYNNYCKLSLKKYLLSNSCVG